MEGWNRNNTHIARACAHTPTASRTGSSSNPIQAGLAAAHLMEQEKLWQHRLGESAQKPLACCRFLTGALTPEGRKPWLTRSETERRVYTSSRMHSTRLRVAAVATSCTPWKAERAGCQLSGHRTPKFSALPLDRASMHFTIILGLYCVLIDWCKSHICGGGKDK